MKKALLTAFIFLAAGFLLLFSFQRDNKAIQKSVKKTPVAAVDRTSKPKAIKPVESPAEFSNEPPVESSTTLGEQSPAAKKADSTQALTASEPEFNETLSAFFADMPRAIQIKNATAQEIHGTPTAVLLAGEKLADIHEYFFSHPHPRDIEMSFYLKCSQQKDFFDSVRAICAARLSQHYFEATGHQISSEIFDNNIDQLRREINL